MLHYFILFIHLKLLRLGFLFVFSFCCIVILFVYLFDWKNNRSWEAETGTGRETETAHPSLFLFQQPKQPVQGQVEARNRQLHTGSVMSDRLSSAAVATSISADQKSGTKDLNWHYSIKLMCIGHTFSRKFPTKSVFAFHFFHKVGHSEFTCCCYTSNFMKG